MQLFPTEHLGVLHDITPRIYAHMDPLEVMLLNPQHAFFKYLLNDQFWKVYADRYIDARYRFKSELEKKILHLSLLLVHRAGDEAHLSKVLMASVDFKFYDIVERMVQDGFADPKADQSYCIRQSCRLGDLRMVKFFLKDRRADPTAMDNYALKLSCTRGFVEIVEALLEDGRADPAAEDSLCLRTACRGKTEVVRLLLKDGRADPSMDNNFCLRKSTVGGHTEIIDMLLADDRVDPSVLEPANEDAQ